MTGTTTWFLRPVTTAILTALAACGGGGGNSSDGTANTPPVAATKITGTTAIGAALAGATVTIKDTSGASVCAEPTITSTDSGTYSCTLASGKVAPFILLVVSPSGATNPMVSVLASTPAQGSTTVLNATPLTTAIVGQLAPDKNPLSVVATPTLIDNGKLTTIVNNFLSQIANTVSAANVQNYNPFSTPIVAATSTAAGNEADRILDLLRITNVGGIPTISTTDNPGAAVALADATSISQPLPAPAAGVIVLPEALRATSTALQSCFSLPTGTRVSAKDPAVAANNGGPNVTGLAPQCQNIAHANYLNNGYKFGQEFYSILNDDTMTGAKFFAPEIIRYTDDATATDNDSAIINIRYLDRNGVAGNILFTVRKFSGSTSPSHNSDWLAFGNQQPIDSSIRAFLRRSEQLAPNPGTGVFAGASASGYESGIDVFVNKDGPNSIGMRAARVKGPGLPLAGLVYTRPAPSVITTQNWLSIRRKDGLTDATSASFAPDSASIFRLQRTNGITGADATTVRPNPNAANANTTAFQTWAHPLDYGAPVGSTTYINFNSLKALNTYTIEVFYENDTAPRYTLTKTILTPVYPATYANTLQWVDLNAATRAYLNPADPKAAATATINLAWSANPLAETIRSAGVYTTRTTVAGTTEISQGTIDVPRGATSAVGTAPGAAGTVFPALTSDGSTNRIIQLRYRVLDGSYKDSFTRFN